ncbi:MAG: hypothetical protein Q4E53_07405 [Eubacteriales bacterium]|nr:hypothetical protein [Eubacteriales bacterium]
MARRYIHCIAWPFFCLLLSGVAFCRPFPLRLTKGFALSDEYLLHSLLLPEPKSGCGLQIGSGRSEKIVKQSERKLNSVGVVKQKTKKADFT